MLWETCRLVMTARFHRNLINIFSDSKKTIKSVFLNSKAVLNCCSSLNVMAEQFEIYQIWVGPGTGIFQEKSADILAMTRRRCQ